MKFGKLKDEQQIAIIKKKIVELLLFCLEMLQKKTYFVTLICFLVGHQMLRMVTSAGIQVKRKFGQHMLCHTCTAIENLYNFDSCICSLPHVDI